MVAWFAPKNRPCVHFSLCRQAGSLNIILYALMLIILCAQKLDFAKFLMQTQVLLERAPVLKSKAVL